MVTRIEPKSTWERTPGPDTGSGLNAGSKLLWIAVASASLPSLFETEWKLELPLGSVYLADLLLICAVIAAWGSVKHAYASALIYYFAVFAVAVGAATGVSAPWIIRDSRPYFYMLAGVVIGAAALTTPRSFRFGIRVFIVIISLTSILAVASQLLAVNIVGTERGAINAVYYNGETQFLSAIRIQSEPIPVALLFLCAGGASWILKLNLSKIIGRNWLKVGILSSLILTVMAYSRNSIVGLVVVMLLAVSIPASIPRAERFVRLLALLVAISVFIGIPIWIGYQFGYFTNVIDSFSGRVVAGIAPDVIGTDPSIGWRFIEMEATQKFVAENPLFGSGFGGFYRDRIAGEPFRGDQGRIYMHNYFTLILVKFGLVIGVLILGIIVTAIIRLVRRGAIDGSEQGRPYSVLACSFGAMLVVSAVAPIMYSRSFAAIGGVLLAVGLASVLVGRSR